MCGSETLKRELWRSHEVRQKIFIFSFRAARQPRAPRRTPAPTVEINKNWHTTAHMYAQSHTPLALHTSHTFTPIHLHTVTIGVASSASSTDSRTSRLLTRPRRPRSAIPTRYQTAAEAITMSATRRGTMKKTVHHLCV